MGPRGAEEKATPGGWNQPGELSSTDIGRKMSALTPAPLQTARSAERVVIPSPLAARTFRGGRLPEEPGLRVNGEDLRSDPTLDAGRHQDDLRGGVVRAIELRKVEMAVRHV